MKLERKKNFSDFYAQLFKSSIFTEIGGLKEESQSLLQLLEAQKTYGQISNAILVNQTSKSVFKDVIYMQLSRTPGTV